VSTSTTVALGDTVQRNADLIVQSLDQDVVMANIDTGHYFGLDRSSKRIWELLEQPKTVGDVCTQLVREFKVEREVCERDVLAFVNEMAREGLVQRVG
jgi:hypothetical protein